MSQTSEQVMRQIQLLIHDEQLMAFVQEKSRTYESLADFSKSEMPCGLLPEEAWELVSFVRRVNGWPTVRSQMPRAGKPLTPDLAFQTVPPAVEAAVNELAARAGTHSQLWASLEPLVHNRRLIQPIVDDLAAAAQRDRIDVGSETIRALVLGTTAPRTDAELLVGNTVALLYQNPPNDFPSNASIASIYGSIMAGVSLTTSELPVVQPVSSMPDAFHLNRVTIEEISNEITHAGQWGVHPLLGVIMTSGTLWNNMTVGTANSFLEIVLRRYALTTIGLPALAVVPYSLLRLNWERGISPEVMEPFRYGEAFLVSEFGLDCTPYLIQMISMMAHYIGKLEREVAAIEEGDEGKRDRVGRDARLSHRQKELLAAMIANPTETADVRSYAQRFDCAVSTARDDLNRLVDLRYCSTTYQGKRQVFWLNDLG